MKKSKRRKHRRRHSGSFAPSRLQRLSRIVRRLVPRKIHRRRHRWKKSRPWLARSVAPIFFLFLLARICLYPFSALARRFLRLWEHREKRHFVQGTLSLAALVGVVLLGIIFQLNRRTLEDDYRDAALSAYRNEDYQSAKVYFERLVELDGGEESSRFDLALTLFQLDETDRADAIIAALAPSGSSGFARAHLWVARRILAAPEVTADQLRQVRAHLMRAKQGMPGSAEIDFQLAQYAMRARRPDVAALHLAEAAKQREELYFDLSLLYASMNEVAKARDAAYLADKYYRGRVALHPDDQDARLRWASVRMNLNDFPRAVAILSEGASLHPGGPFEKALAGAFVAQYDRVMRRPTRNHQQLVQLLRTALEHDPSSPAALHRLIEFGDGETTEAKEAKEILEAMLVNGEANAFVHFVLGTRAWKTDSVSEALWHFERAYKLDENLGPVANNLAWVLAHKDEPELERALSVIDSVLERWPGIASYLDTRGQIFAALNRWEDALDDLERALPGIKNNRQLHQTLATVYDNLGRTSLAERHQLVADSLKESEKSDN